MSPKNFVMIMMMTVFVAVTNVAAARTDGPVLRVDETEFDGGLVAQNGKVEAVFTLRNIGTDTLFITSLRAPCGCTVAEYDQVIPPRSVGYVRPIVDVTGMSRGRMSRTVNLTTNAVNMPTVTLVVTANVQ